MSRRFDVYDRGRRVGTVETVNESTGEVFEIHEVNGPHELDYVLYFVDMDYGVLIPKKMADNLIK